jgi:hypothetical protein
VQTIIFFALAGPGVHRYLKQTATRIAGGFVCPAKRANKGHVGDLKFPRYPGAQHWVLDNAIMTKML